MLKGKKGFTLIELIVVIVIIGILAAVAIPRFMGAQDRARKGAAESDINSIRQALGLYEIDWATFDCGAGGDATWATLRPLLKDPAGGWYISTLPPADAAASTNFTNFSFNGSAATYSIAGKAKDNATSDFTATPELFSWD